MIVAIQAVRAAIRDVQVHPAVVIEVAGGNAEAPPFIRDAGARGDVREGQIVIVPEERGARRFNATTHASNH